MRTFATAAILSLLVATTGLTAITTTAQAQATVTVDPAKIINGFMNVYELPINGGGFVFASGWGFADLRASYAGNILTFGPCFVNDVDPFWYIGGGAPGNPGNKTMEANAYAEETGPLAGQTVTFNGEVLSNTLTGAHTVIAFIKDFAADFSTFTQSTVVLPASGPFSISLATVNDPARHVQYGFQMVGPNVWIDDLPAFGTVVVGPEQPVATESKTWGQVKSLNN